MAEAPHVLGDYKSVRYLYLCYIYIGVVFLEPSQFCGLNILCSSAWGTQISETCFCVSSSHNFCQLRLAVAVHKYSLQDQRNTLCESEKYTWDILLLRVSVN